MSSMTNSLERLRKEKEEIKRQRREFKIKFVCLYVSILSHLKANPDNKVTKGSFGDAKKITVANDGFFLILVSNMTTQEIKCGLLYLKKACR
jgi:hypothetical protein